MIIEKIKLTNYRNIEKIECNADPKVNVIVGNNGQGKTNFVEAIDYLATLKSFRGDNRETLIKINNDFAVIETIFKETSVKHQARLVLSNSGLKIKLDNDDLKRNGDFIGLVNVVTFSPSDISLFKDSPKKRREFINQEISKISPSYYYSVLDYQKLLKERNEVLKQEKIDIRYLEVITHQLAKNAFEIMKKRIQFIDNLNEILTEKFIEISKIEKKASIKYETFIDNEINEENIYQNMMSKYEEDLRYKSTQVGIHRDDFIFLLDELPMSSFASQGQMRLGIIATKLSLLDLSYKLTGSKAIVVLDDVFSELDEIRQKQVLTRLTFENQLFITTAQPIEQIKKIINTGKMFKITNGYLETEE